MTALQGKLCFYTETGTEGGYWAFESNKPVLDARYVYDKLHILKNGDRLMIQHPTEKSIVWDGIIDLKQFHVFTEAAHGMWIHAEQKNITRETWSKYFFEKYSAKLWTS